MFLKLFPIWAPLAALLGYTNPDIFVAAKSSIIPLLTLVMLCMGMTLKPSDFIVIKTYHKALLSGLVLQFTVMPVLALCIAKLMQLEQQLTLGLLIVGTVAGGTASNVMTYIAKGNVALSVSMTALSTLLSVVMTPLLLTLLIGSSVDIPAQAMLASLFKIIVLPVALGVVINYYAHNWVKKIEPSLAPTAVITILIIIAIVVALNQSRLADVASAVIIATLLHNVLGLLIGYSAAKAMKFDSVICRTIAIEVGMQNSGLATALAIKFFSQAAALPGAIFSIWLNITGSMFAAWFVHNDKKETAD